jgi:hypothetical protein
LGYIIGSIIIIELVKGVEEVKRFTDMVVSLIVGKTNYCDMKIKLKTMKEQTPITADEKQIGDTFTYWIDNIESSEMETGQTSKMEKRTSKIVNITEYFYYLEDGTEIPRKN